MPLLLLALLLLQLLLDHQLLHALYQVVHVALPWLNLSFDKMCCLLQIAGYIAAEGS